MDQVPFFKGIYQNLKEIAIQNGISESNWYSFYMQSEYPIARVDKSKVDGMIRRAIQRISAQVEKVSLKSGHRKTVLTSANRKLSKQNFFLSDELSGDNKENPSMAVLNNVPHQNTQGATRNHHSISNQSNNRQRTSINNNNNPQKVIFVQEQPSIQEHLSGCEENIITRTILYELQGFTDPRVGYALDAELNNLKISVKVLESGRTFWRTLIRGSQYRALPTDPRFGDNRSDWICYTLESTKSLKLFGTPQPYHTGEVMIEIALNDGIILRQIRLNVQELKKNCTPANPNESVTNRTRSFYNATNISKD